MPFAAVRVLQYRKNVFVFAAWREQPSGDSAVTAYVLANFRVHHQDLYERYSAAALPIVASFGGKVIAADNGAEDLWAPGRASRAVMIAFATRESAKAWVTSPEYGAVAQQRIDASDTISVLLLEGL